MCDDLGWGDVGFQGHPVIRTPHLDDMARHALRFTRFYAASAVCSPTRGSVLTGRHPQRYGITHANTGHMLPRELTLAELLRDQGYATGHFGKWHLGTLTTTLEDANRGGPRGAAHFAPPQHHGYDVCFCTESKVPTCDPMLRPRDTAPGIGWDSLTDHTQAVPYGTHYWDEHGEIVTAGLNGDDSRVIMDRVVQFVQSAARRNQPLFAVVWFHAPHLPVVAAPEYAALYGQEDSYTRNYYGCITALDEQIGRLRATLRQEGVADNTLVTFCSDNGPEGAADTAPGRAGPFRGRKRDLFEGGIRVPALIEWPARITPGVTSFPAVTSDYLPTIAEILGVELPPFRPLDGISLMPVFDGVLTERPQPICFEFQNRLAVSDNRFKLVHIPDGSSEGNDRSRRVPSDSREFLLFDLLADPGETTDIAAEHPQVVARLTRALRDWQQSCRASADGQDEPDRARPATPSSGG
jgi:arylsulfatase A-like enzyme